jgi:hypothetical protein
MVWIREVNTKKHKEKQAHSALQPRMNQKPVEIHRLPVPGIDLLLLRLGKPTDDQIHRKSPLRAPPAVGR